MISKQDKVLIKAIPVINSIKKQAKKEAFSERITEIVRGKNFWEKLELTIKIWA